MAICRVCNGQKLILTNKRIEPCSECSTAEFSKTWEIKEAERGRKIRAGTPASRPEMTSE